MNILNQIVTYKESLDMHYYCSGKSHYIFNQSILKNIIEESFKEVDLNFNLSEEDKIKIALSCSSSIIGGRLMKNKIISKLQEFNIDINIIEHIANIGVNDE